MAESRRRCDSRYEVATIERSSVLPAWQPEFSRHPPHQSEGVSTRPGSGEDWRGARMRRRKNITAGFRGPNGMLRPARRRCCGNKMQRRRCRRKHPVGTEETQRAMRREQHRPAIRGRRSRRSRDGLHALHRAQFHLPGHIRRTRIGEQRPECVQRKDRQGQPGTEATSVIGAKHSAHLYTRQKQFASGSCVIGSSDPAFIYIETCRW